MMELEERIYDMPVEVKQVVISVQDYHVRREISTVPWGLSKANRQDLIKGAKHGARYDLLDGLQKFVHCEIDEERNFVEAVIWMPYVKDEIVKQLEKHNKTLENLNSRLGVECEAWRRKTEELSEYIALPWWKKLFKVE